MPIPRNRCAGVSTTSFAFRRTDEWHCLWTVVLHVLPEAAIGGPLPAQSGDMIKLDVPARLISEVDDAVLEQRRFNGSRRRRPSAVGRSFMLSCIASPRRRRS
jgi:hypothetical protein